MKKYTLYQVDAFTKEKFAGNPAGVITNADGLSNNDMQKIAREMNNSETVFIFSSSCDSHDVHLKYFTPTNEVPICGHATIAAHYVRAMEENLSSAMIVQKTGVGNLPVEIIKDKRDYTIVMTQGEVEFGHIIESDEKRQLLTALNIKEEDLMPHCPIQIVSTGHSKILIGVESMALLNSLMPDHEALKRLSKTIGSNGYYVFTFDSDEDEILTKGRMFAPAVGINEDPVTGNATGPLGAYLIFHDLVKHDGRTFSFKAKQGEAINRPGVVDVSVEIEKNLPTKVTVAGTAVIVYKTELEI